MSKKKTKRVDTRRAMEEESIVRRHRFFATGAPESLLMLLAYVVLAATIFSRREGGVIEWRNLLIMGAMVLIITLALGLYLFANEPRIIKNHLRGAMLLALLLLMLLFVRLSASQQGSPYITIAPVMFTGIVLTIAYSQRTALAVASYLIFVSVLLPAEKTLPAEIFGVLFCCGAGLGVTVMQLHDISTRSKLIWVTLTAAITVFLMAVLTGLWQQVEMKVWGYNALVAAASAGGAGVLVSWLLPVIEKLFSTATNLTLLDYSEASKPLLKRLSLEAPGTFNHSWQLGILAEAAANAIDANGLLTRVGCYYHDVGKINKPRYFVENQAELVNEHKELSPTMSRIIIFGHVKDGMELAREYRLPKVLRQFIATHHGTTLVKYFYHEAMKQAQQTGDPVNEMEFRYPGPKPETKEAAIVMLTDAVEGASRAMQDPTPSRIESIVHQLAMERLEDGQFDDCDLTMRELKKIESSLIKSLCGMYHTRIAYPKLEKPVRPSSGYSAPAAASAPEQPVQDANQEEIPRDNNP